MNGGTRELVVVGGGPAGLAAAVAARDAGCGDILILERDRELGGILNQCIHNGFGLHTFQEELTGPEYADRYIRQAQEREIPYLLNTIVIDIRMEKNGYKLLTAMNREQGLFEIRARSIILAMGCRERPRGALNIPGYRPAGIYSAGTAQRFVNMEGRMPGRQVVILGSGDIGLIMARRMKLEGAEVKVVAELMPYSGGLKRNIVQCLDDFGIPLRLSTTVVDIHGHDRVEGVTLARVDENSRPIPGTEEYIACDTLLLSCGLIPENELSAGLGVKISPVTNGPVVNESLETSIPGVFACGNVLHVHDLVDYVSSEAAQAGRYAAVYAGRGPEGYAGGNAGRGPEASADGNTAGCADRNAEASAGGNAATSADGNAAGRADRNAVASADGNAAGRADKNAAASADGNAAGCADRNAEASAGGNAAGRADGNAAASAERSAEDCACGSETAWGEGAQTELCNSSAVAILPEAGVRYTVPSILRPLYMDDKQIIRFRVGKVFRNCVLAVYLNEKCVIRQKKRVMAPGEMEQVILKRNDLDKLPAGSRVVIRVEPQEQDNAETGSIPVEEARPEGIHQEDTQRGGLQTENIQPVGWKQKELQPEEMQQEELKPEGGKEGGL